MLIELLYVVCFSAVGLTAAVTERVPHVSNAVFEAPRPLRDRFRVIQSNLTETRLQEEIDDFTAYKCEVMVVVTNEASDWFKMWCSSPDDKIKEARVYQDQSFSFTFKPKADGLSEFRCIIDYKNMWASFDVYNEDEWYTCSRDNSNVYRYFVRHDGIYTNDKHKIRALFKGHAKYSLWEDYNGETKETDGLLMDGYVDGGMCSDIPSDMNDMASAVTVCEHQCVILYEHYRCEGDSKKFQADEGCIDFGLDDLDKIASSVKGC